MQLRPRDLAFFCLAALLAACSGPKTAPQADAGPRRPVDAGPPRAAAPVIDIKPEVAPPQNGVLPAGDPQRRLDTSADQYFRSNPSRRIYIQVDKPMYQPGETVWVRTAVVRAATLTGDEGEAGVLYQLVSPKGSVVLEKRVKAVGGNGFNDFELPDSIQGGEYTIKVRTDAGAEEKRTFIVSAYEAPRFKKTLEFLKKAYGVGDTVAATVEVKRPTGEAFANRELTALVTLDGAELPRVKFRTDDKGSAVARVKLPAAIEKGDGILTILVDDAGVTESITKRVPIILNKLKLSFYPEGGDLVAGLPSRVYFAAQNMIDKPADIEGKVVDDHGTTMATFASVRDGLGRFALTPATGRAYSVEVTKPVGVVEKFQLPAAVEHGCVLRTYDDLLGKEPTIRAAVHCTESRTVIVVAVLREQRLASATVKAEPGRPAVVYLPLSRPEAMGVVRVSVLSETLEPLAERLVFRNWNRGLRVTVKPDKQSYTPRGQVVLDVETRDLDGRPVAAELAMAAVDDTVLSFADDKTAHIVARLMLEAEVPGKVEEPNWYFKDDKQEAPLALEMLLGTRGWRKFEWRKVTQPPVDYGFGGLGLRGIGRGGGGAGEGIGLGRLGGIGKGRGFAPGGPPRPAPAAAPPMAVAAAPAAPAPAMPAPKMAGAPAKLPQGAAGFAQPRAAAGGAPVARPMATHAAEKTLPVARGPRLPAEEPALADRKEAKAARLKVAAEPRGAVVRRAGGQAEARRQGILGVLRADQGRAVADVLANKNEEKAAEQQAVDKDWAAAAGERRPAAGWAKVRVFPVPSYTPGYDGPRTDFRETIYWNPSVKTDQSGKTKVSFFVSDAITSFRVTTEGLSAAGLCGRNETVIKSKLPFFMEVKLPLEVSVGDKLDLPLTLKNEQQQELPVGVRATFAAALKPLEAPPAGDVRLAANSGQTQFHQLEVGKGADKVEVSFAAQAQGLKDEFTRTLKVVPTGFPRTDSFSGTLAGRATRSFDLKGATEGSIVARATFYPSPMASMITGLDSILREPYGCFEQASSSNYPNIMVVRYMQDHNVAKPQVLERANRLLEAGYRKITSFESKGRGYEWFGGDPAHEALTAYGLMEFADMKAVYGSVDQGMVKRTAQWLQSRRDGRGGYTRNPRALDSFGGANQQVTDAYIVFALTEAGMTDAATELRAVVANARASNDPYVVALATRAAYNAGSPDAPALARKLAGMQQADGRFMGTTHSITRSGGQGLAVETTSIAILALLSSKGYPGELRKAVTWLSGARSGWGGFGSTQATILALKALTAYDQAARQMLAGGEITVMVNGQEVKKVKFEKGREDPLVIDGLGPSFKAGSNQVELRMAGGSPLPFTVAVDYYTPDPASSPEAPFTVQTAIAKNVVKMGETVRVTTTLDVTSDQGQPMTLVRLGIPGGLSYQNWQLKELVDKKVIDFYETRAREVIFYFRALPPKAHKEIAVDLVANVPGQYTAPATSTYLYYTAENKAWASPLKVQVTRP